jgi:hypothetical protein
VKLPRNAEEKAQRYLTEGRLKVERIEEERGLVVASCRGSDTTYRLGFDPAKGEWRCTCEASSKFGRRCAHLIALQLVVERPGNGGAR